MKIKDYQAFILLEVPMSSSRLTWYLVAVAYFLATQKLGIPYVFMTSSKSI